MRDHEVVSRFYDIESKVRRIEARVVRLEAAMSEAVEALREPAMKVPRKVVAFRIEQAMEEEK